MNTNTKEKKELLDLTIYAFHKPLTAAREAAFYKLLEFSKAYRHLENERLTSMVIDTHFDVFWKKQQLKMSGVGYVASYPEARGNGAIRQLMIQLLRENYEAGTALSYLAPFSYQFYGKFGYSYAFDQKSYTMKAIDFPKGQKTKGEITREVLTESAINDDSADSLLSVLTEIHQQAYNQGSLIRPSYLWDYYFKHKSQPYFAVYREEGKALGYLIYEFSEMTFVIRELIFLTESAKQALYRFVYSHSGSFEKVSWVATSDTQLEYDMPEPTRATIQLIPYMQARIINLHEFLKINGQPNFAAEIVDELIPENNQIVGTGIPEKMTIGEFTAKVLRENHAILREYF